MGSLHYVLLLYALIAVAQAETSGKVFLVAFLKNSGTIDPQVLIANHYTKPASVVVSLPRNATAPLHEGTIEGGQTITVTVPYSLRMDNEGFNDKAILVESSELISVVGRNFETGSVDEFLVFPLDKLGHRHTILTFSDMDYECEYAIISTSDNADVQITHGNSTTVSLILDQFEAFRLSASVDDLTGMEIHSNVSLAVFAGGNKATKTGTKGHMAEQLIPVRAWGRTFMASSVSLKSDALRLVVHNETVAVRILRNSTRKWQFHIVHPFSFMELDLGSVGSEHYLLEANNSVLVGQFPTNNYKKEMNKIRSFNQIPAVEQYESVYRLPQNQLLSEQNIHYFVNYSNEIELMKGQKLYQVGFERVFTEGLMALDPVPIDSFSSTLSSKTHEFGMTYHGQTALFSRLVDIKLIAQSQECILTAAVESDGFDNDCDGRIDEEMINGKDDDRDRKTDEDTYMSDLSNEFQSDSTTSQYNTVEPTTGSSIGSSDGNQDITRLETDPSLKGDQTTAKTTSNHIDTSGSTYTMTTGTPTSKNIPTTTQNTATEKVTKGTTTQSEQITTTEQTSNGEESVQNGTGINVPQNPPQSTVTTTHFTNLAPTQQENGGEVTQAEQSSTAPVPADEDQTTNDVEQDENQVEQTTPAGVTTDDNQTTRRKHTPPKQPPPTNPHTETKAQTTTGNEMTEKMQRSTTKNEPEVVLTTRTAEQTVAQNGQTLAQEKDNSGKNDKTTIKMVDSTSTADLTKPQTTSASPGTVQKSVSADGMGILTILAPSFVCGVPLLVVFFCCIRSIIAGVCRKKVSPNDKRNLRPIQPVWRNQPGY